MNVNISRFFSLHLLLLTAVIIYFIVMLCVTYNSSEFLICVYVKNWQMCCIECTRCCGLFNFKLTNWTKKDHVKLKLQRYKFARHFDRFNFLLFSRMLQWDIWLSHVCCGELLWLFPVVFKSLIKTILGIYINILYYTIYVRTHITHSHILAYTQHQWKFNEYFIEQ